MRIETTLIPAWATRRLMSDLWNDVDSYFDDMSAEEKSTPACDIIEMDSHFLVRMDVPGFKKDDLRIELAKNELTVSGERTAESFSDKKVRFQRYERVNKNFSRTFTLPESIDSGKVEAHCEDGVLELYLPKQASAKPRQIEVQSGRTGLLERFTKREMREAKDVKIS